MKKDRLSLQNDTIYESLITTVNSDNTINTKPIGIIFENNQIRLDLFYNRTLQNIKCNKIFTIEFTTSPLLYTKALFNKFNPTDYKKEGNYYNLLKSDYVIHAKLIKIDKFMNKSKIIAEIVNEQEENNSIPTINRATNKIIELLVKYTRINFMTKEEKQLFKEEIIKSEGFIEKVGNQNHIESFNILKSEIEKNNNL